MANVQPSVMIYGNNNGTLVPLKVDVDGTVITSGGGVAVMTTTQRDAIANPAAGLVIYNSTTAKLNVYTTAWEAVTSV